MLEKEYIVRISAELFVTASSEHEAEQKAIELFSITDADFEIEENE